MNSFDKEIDKLIEKWCYQELDGKLTLRNIVTPEFVAQLLSLLRRVEVELLEDILLNSESIDPREIKNRLKALTRGGSDE